MAFIPSESPNILVKEYDLSGVVPGVTTSTGAFLGDFNWGPIDQPVLVSNEAELVNTFGSPALLNDSSVIDYISANSFLKYSANMYVTRASTAIAANAYDSDAGAVSILIKNDEDWLTKKSGAVTGSHTFIAKHAGAAGSGLEIAICGHCDSIVGDSDFNNWAYAGAFDGRPGTSAFVSALSADSAVAYDEVHVAVIDADGKFTGVPGTIVETYPYVSLATNAKGPEGSTNFVVDVINNKSEFVRCAQMPNDYTPATAAAFTAAANGTANIAAPTSVSLVGGVNSATLTPGAFINAASVYEDPDIIQVDFLIAPSLPTKDDQVTVVNALTGIASAQRKDCVVVTSPNRDAVVNNAPSSIVTDTVAFGNALNASSYLIVDNNFLKVYDKYNDQYVYIPAAPSTAGVMALTDDVSAPWFSPAGSRRGQYYGVASLAYSPTKAQRDTLYKAGINPIVNLPGQGVLLYGDKTKLGRPSAFDRINVRRLFLGVERAIKAAAQNVMFEFNDEFTRAEFVNIIEPFLREIKGRRGITDFRVVCDETNNTSSVIDSNQFVASVFIKPARSINYVTLNFVAVRTGVDFDEVVGLV
jgi:phage tail sheath protein FI